MKLSPLSFCKQKTAAEKEFFIAAVGLIFVFIVRPTGYNMQFA